MVVFCLERDVVRDVGNVRCVGFFCVARFTIVRRTETNMSKKEVEKVQKPHPT